MQMRQLDSAVGFTAQHYRNLGHYSRNEFPAWEMEGLFWAIDAATWNYFLEVLPPMYVDSGFMLIEALTDTPEGHTLRGYYVKDGDRYWCGYCTKHNYRDMLAFMREQP